MSNKKKNEINRIWATVITTVGVIIVALFAFPLFQRLFEPKPSPTATSTDTPIPTITFAIYTPSVIETQTALSAQTSSLHVLEQIDEQLRNSISANFSHLVPTRMKVDETFPIELLISISLTPDELATKVVENSGLATSTAEPGELVTDSGENVIITGDTIEITPQVKAVLIPTDSQAFEIQRIHDNDIQFIGSQGPTSWRWVIKAKKEGAQNLVLVVYRLIKFNGSDSWRQVKTYESEINVQITLGQRLELVDWKWVLGIIITLVIIPLFWKWYNAKHDLSLMGKLDNKGKAKNKASSGQNNKSKS